MFKYKEKIPSREFRQVTDGRRSHSWTSKFWYRDSYSGVTHLWNCSNIELNANQIMTDKWKRTSRTKTCLFATHQPQVPH